MGDQKGPEMFWMRIMLAAALLLLAGSTGMVRAAGKTNIAVLDLDVASGVSEAYKQVLSDRLRQEMFKTGCFTVVERNTMEEVLREQSLYLTGCTSTECAVEVGKILGVSQMVAGTIGQVGTVHTVNVRLIDVETAEVLAAESVDCTCSIEEVLTSRLHEVAELLATAAEKTEKEIRPTRREAPTPTERWRVDVPDDSWLSNTMLYIEDIDIRAISTRFGTSGTLGNSKGWFGAMGNGLAVEFAPYREYRPVFMIGGGGMGAEDHHISYGAGGMMAGMRLYKFIPDASVAKGTFAGFGAAFNTVTRTASYTDHEEELDSDYDGTSGHLSTEVFIGSLFDLHWNLDGRTLFTFVELNYSYMVTSTEEPNSFISLMTGIGIKMATFDR